jgi:lysophospholipase L1-like esterase
MVATIPSRTPTDAARRTGDASTLVPGFNDQVKFLAASKGMSLVDAYQAFAGDLSLIGSDGLHPTAAGYHLVADSR